MGLRTPREAEERPSKAWGRVGWTHACYSFLSDVHQVERSLLGFPPEPLLGAEPLFPRLCPLPSPQESLLSYQDPGV